MVLRNPISSIRQSRIMAQSPMRGGGSPMMGGAPPSMPSKPYRGLFGGPAPVGPQINFDTGGPDIEQDVPVRPPQDEASRFYEEMERLRQQAGPGLSAYRQALNEVPSREEYKPNWLTRIAAGLSGFSAGMRDPGEGIRVAQDVNTSKYRSAMADYSNRLGTLKEQADIEQEDLRTQLAGLKAAREMGLKYDEYLMKKRESDNLITTRGVTAEAARTRAEAYAKAQNRPGYDHFVQEDGSILYQNKNDQNDSFIVPAKAIQAAQLKVSQRQAGAAESNAATARGRLALDQQLDPRRVAAQEATAGASVYRALNPPERSQNNVFVTPGAQQSARDLALEQMADDPEWSKFLGKTWTGRQVGPGDFSADDWADFQEALQDRINEIMSMQRGGG